MIHQRTIKFPVQSQGISLHSGKQTTISILPAEPNQGIVFKRIDVNPPVIIPANVDYVTKTTLSTTIGNEGLEISTIEHLLSVLHGLSIDNAIIEIDDSEMPAMDGSASSFVFLIQSAGIVIQKELKKCIVITKKIEIIGKNKSISIEPFDGFCIDFSIKFEHKAVKNMQSNYHYIHSTTNYIYEISRARTFGFVEDVETLQKQNLALGASLRNTTAIGKDGILNEEGLRYSSELVRHKILDTIGDLYLLGHNIIGSITASRSGHDLNNKILKEIEKNTDSWHYLTLDEESVKGRDGVVSMFS